VKDVYMPPDIVWYNAEQTAFTVCYESGWTWEEHHALLHEINRLRDEHHLALRACLFDLRGTTFPFDSPVGPHYRDPREGVLVVVVIDNLFTRTVGHLAIRARDHQDRIQIVSTLEEGKALLDKKLASVPAATASRMTRP